MHDAAVVSLDHRRTGLNDVTHRFVDAELAALQQLCLQIVALEKFHDQVRNAVFSRVDIDHARRVSVPQSGCGLGFTCKPVDQRRLRQDDRLRYLDGNVLPQPRVDRTEHDAHHALTEDGF